MSTNQPTPRDLHRIGAQIYNKPWAITDEYMDRICGIFEHAKQAGSGAVHPDFKSLDDSFDVAGTSRTVKGMTAFPGGKEQSEFARRIAMIQGVAVIPVFGVLTPRASWMDNVSDLTSYEQLDRMLSDALAAEPAAIALEIDSPGGNCLGLEEIAARINDLASMASTPPIIAVVNPFCASAAYYIASQCNSIHIDPSGMIGSIGTLCRMTYQPLELHTVKSAELKTIAQGSMSLAQLEDIAASVRTFFEQFRNAIERGRPRLDVDSVATGQMWIGQDAVDAGIADQIGGLQGVIDTYGDEEFDDDGALEMLYQSESDYAVL